jgi:hypothetical protein
VRPRFESTARTSRRNSALLGRGGAVLRCACGGSRGGDERGHAHLHARQRVAAYPVCRHRPICKLGAGHRGVWIEFSRRCRPARRWREITSTSSRIAITCGASPGSRALRPRSGWGGTQLELLGHGGALRAPTAASSGDNRDPAGFPRRSQPSRRSGHAAARASGTVPAIRVPCDGCDSISRLPPTAAIRARMLVSPPPAATRAGSKPGPSSLMLKSANVVLGRRRVQGLPAARRAVIRARRARDAV